MNIVKYDPFRDLRSLQDEMNRLFSINFQRGGAAQDEIMRGAWTPSVDIYEEQRRNRSQSGASGNETGRR